MPIPDAYIVALDEAAQQIRQGDLHLAADSWYAYPADLASIRREPHRGGKKTLAENRLYSLYQAAVTLLAATAEQLNIDSTPIVQASQIRLHPHATPLDHNKQQLVCTAEAIVARLLSKTALTNKKDKPDTKRNTNGHSLPKLPDSADVRDLCHLLQDKAPLRQGQAIEIARDFAGKDDGKAESLLRQARRYSHLWQTPKP